LKVASNLYGLLKKDLSKRYSLPVSLVRKYKSGDGGNEPTKNMPAKQKNLKLY
jgi:hypothetical protein